MKKRFTKEPIIHSHITNCLPNSHPLAFESILCDYAGESVHAANNECMQTWFETEFGNYCLDCFKLTPVMEDYFEDQLEIGK